MKEKKELYQMDKEGNILNYNINYDIGRFSFFIDKKRKSTFEPMLNGLNKLMFKIIGDKLYKIDFENLEKEYIKSGIGDVPHFVHQYIWQRYRFPEPIYDIETSELMYFEAVDYINEKIEKRLLPKDIKEQAVYLNQIK